MPKSTHLQTVIDELHEAIGQIDQNEAQALVDEIQKADKVFVNGSGRSGMMAQAFAMRLMHMGVDAYVVGETVTGTYEENDLLIVASGSGTTSTIVPTVEKAKKIGGKVAAITITPDSPMGEMADLIVQMPGATKDQSNETITTAQPMGSLFEQTLLVFFDSLILAYMEANDLDSDKMYGKHANLE